MASSTRLLPGVAASLESFSYIRFFLSDQQQFGPGKTPGEILFRVCIYSILIVAAIYYLIPLIIMVFTSVKTMNDIRTGTLISYPREFTQDAWKAAWGSACIGVTCHGIKGYFWNS